MLSRGGVNNGGVMTTPIKRIATVCLVLALGMTGVSMAVARAGMSLHGIVELCRGTEIMVRPAGPDGRPQERSHICPDCTVGALAMPVGGLAARDPTRCTTIETFGPRWVAPTLAIRAAPARAPPLLLT